MITDINSEDRLVQHNREFHGFIRGGAPVWATLSNTQGGPVHDAESRIIDVHGNAIPRLYAAGELGSAFGHLYLSGGNIAECFVTGRLAGRNAALLPPWGDVP